MRLLPCTEIGQMAYIQGGTSDPSAPPNFLSALVPSRNFMRLSLKKAAYVAVFESSVVGNPEFAPNEQPAWRPKQGKRDALVGRQISGLLTSLAPWTGAPGSHQRTWEEKNGGEAPTKAFISRSRFSYSWSESMRKKPFSTQVRWCEPGAPVQGARLGGKPGKRRTKGQPTAKQS